MAYERPVMGGGRVSNDVIGSRDSWEEKVIQDLIDNYTWGRGGMPGYGDASIGQPNPADAGKGTVSFATEMYFENYVKKFAGNDPWITEQYGTAPTRSATWVDDPNSASSINGTYKDRAADTSRENALDRTSRERISAADNATQLAAANISAGASRYGADQQLAGVKLQVDNSWRESVLNDATRRYIAEGDWGTQRFIADLNNTGQNNRLTQQIGADKAIADQADATRRFVATGDWASNKYIADTNNAGQNTRLTTQIAADKAIADQASADRRFVATGDWASQKYITDTNNAGSLVRLQLELGQRDEELAQQALGEKNRHGEAMTGLALEVAKYDAELGASPRNWLKYAGWLKSRDIVVSGLTLAMAAQEVPDNAMSAQMVANTTGMGMAGLETEKEAQTAASGTPAASAAQTQAAATATGGTGAPITSPGASVPAPAGGAQQQAQAAAAPAQETPAQMAQRLLGSFGQTSADASQASLQATVNSLNTTGGRRSSFGGDGSAMVNSQGISIPEANGSQVDYRNFGRLLPTQQEMKIGAIESVRGAAGVSDWLQEIEKSRPKGGNAQAAAFG